MSVSNPEIIFSYPTALIFDLVLVLTAAAAATAIICSKTIHWLQMRVGKETKLVAEFLERGEDTAKNRQ